jgi:hypothetical protein
MELYESHGPLVKMAYLIQEDRREGFQQVFHLGPDPASEE